jgi:hypothetical protein
MAPPVIVPPNVPELLTEPLTDGPGAERIWGDPFPGSTEAPEDGLETLGPLLRLMKGLGNVNPKPELPVPTGVEFWA